MKDYIILNKYIRDRIRRERKTRKINGVIFSKEKLDKSGSYISHLENGIINKIEREDLEKIFRNILNIAEDELEEYIDNLLKESEESSNTIGTDSEEPLQEASTSKKIRLYYDKNNMTETEASFKKIVSNLSNAFNNIFEEEPEFIFHSLARFLENLQLDAGLTLILNRFPLKKLKDTDHEIRQQLLDEVTDVFNKYFEEYAKKEDDEASPESNDE